MSENAEQKKLMQKRAKLAPIPVFQQKSGEEVTALQPQERNPRILHTKLLERALKLELGERDDAPTIV